MIGSDELLNQLKDYEGKWVALYGPEGQAKIIASGNDAYEAKQEAEKKGYQEVILLKVAPFDMAYVPLS